MTDHVATLPSRLAERHAATLEPFELPFASPLFSLHAAWHPRQHADPALRWLYFFSSMLGAAMVATGLVLWTVKRRTRPGASLAWLRFTQAGNAACVAGLITAVAGFLLANRLLPPGLAERAQWEVHGFFLCWAATALYAAWRGGAAAWRTLWWLAAALWCALPVLDAGLAGLPQRALFVGFDSAFAATGLLCLYLGCRMPVATRQ